MGMQIYKNFSFETKLFSKKNWRIIDPPISYQKAKKYVPNNQILHSHLTMLYVRSA